MQSQIAPNAVTSGPPRHVSAPACVGTLLGAKHLQTGCVFLLASMSVIWFLLQCQVFSPLTGLALIGPTTKVEGVVQEVLEGDHQTYAPYASDGAGNAYAMERYTVTGVRYGYMGPDGTPLTGIATGLRKGAHEKYAEAGASIPVEFSNWHPEFSRVPGLESDAHVKTWILTTAFWGAVVFAVFCLFAILFGLTRGTSNLRLMRRGAVTTGKLINMQSVSLLGIVNLRRKTYSYSDGHQELRVVMTGSPDDGTSPNSQTVFFDPRKPVSIAPADAIAGHFEMDGNGNISEGDSNPYNFLWLPTACAVAGAWFVLNLLGQTETPAFVQAVTRYMEI